MPIRPELEPLLARMHAAGTVDCTVPVAERREQVYAAIEMQLAHAVERAGLRKPVAPPPARPPT